ncbi:DinB family protein [Mesoterricola silvestris]|uniref:DinB-like domain-containing protein n=1 Tax=Mesoterricola silvestris TaxID=2927979 RepID=A0AA48GTW5_9BACT|nr:DinB family protein [Mesoterricola silvestris]BDU74280.1 hypothetical protein METEAL_34540 [Mesoterricola silvestris]
MLRNATILAALLAATQVLAQNSEPPKVVKALGATLDGSLALAEKQFVPALEAMPEGGFAFAPTAGEFKGVRNVAAQARHVGAINYWVGSVILGEKPPAEVGKGDGPEALKSKAEVMAYLKASYAYAHKALNSINDKNALVAIKSPFGSGDTSRVTLANILLAHTMDHYGQVVVYLRMNGIVPPASR